MVELGEFLDVLERHRGDAAQGAIALAKLVQGDDPAETHRRLEKAATLALALGILTAKEGEELTRAIAKLPDGLFRREELAGEVDQQLARLDQLHASKRSMANCQAEIETATAEQLKNRSKLELLQSRLRQLTAAIGEKRRALGGDS